MMVGAKGFSRDSARRKTVSGWHGARTAYTADSARNGFCDGASCSKLNWCMFSAATSPGAAARLNPYGSPLHRHHVPVTGSLG